MELKTEIRRLDELQADPANPRTHDERNLEAIKASLREHGQVEPLVIQASTSMVIAGNGRREAMMQLGWTEASCNILDIDDVQARRLSIALNRSGELAGWDEQVLTDHLQSLEGVGGEQWLQGLGFDDNELELLVAAYSEVEDPEPDPPVLAPAPVEPPMPTSSVKQIQLYLDEDTLPKFKAAVKSLGHSWNLDNQTDVVLRAVLQMASAECGS